MPTGKTPAESPLPQKEDQDFYLLFRHQLVAEDNLVNHRMTWLLLTQTFLLAIMGGALSQGFQNHIPYLTVFKWLICVFGIGGSILSIIGISAAERAIKRLREDYWSAYGGRDRLPRHLPQIDGGDDNHLLGYAPLAMPIVCIGVWIIIGCFVR